MKSQFIAVLALVAIGASGCDTGDDRLAEKAKIEGGAALDAELTSLAKRSKEMEVDLAERQRFYQAVRGVYEGDLVTDHGNFKVRVILVPTLPPYRAERVRTLEEVSSDLTNLYFKAQVIQWNPAVRLSAVDCRVENIRPDMETGEVSIVSPACANLYTLKLGADGPSSKNALDIAKTSAQLALDIREERLKSNSAISGQMFPSNDAAVYDFQAFKVSP